jgi:hypothetical protein
MLNLPTGSYAKNAPSLAVADASNYSVYTIPAQFSGVGFLIARFTYTLDAGGTTWVLYDTEDLRGKVPNVTAGGGAGGVGVIDFTGLLDTPNAYTDQARRILQVNDGETAVEFIDNPHKTVTRDVTHSDANWYELFVDGASTQLVIPSDTVWVFDALIAGGTAGMTKSFAFRIVGVVENDGGTTTVKTSTVTTIEDGDDVSFDVRATADDSADALSIEVSDSDGGSDVVRWKAKIIFTDVTY